MFKNDIETTRSKSVKSKKQIEINTTVNQNKEYGEEDKFEREKKKTKKPKVKNILMEANEIDCSSYPDVCSELKRFKKKKSKARSSNIIEEEHDSKIEKKLTKVKNPPESEIDEDICGSLKKKKKRKNKFKPDNNSGPQNISERNKRNICEDDPSRVQDESECNIKKKRKINDSNADVEEGLTKGNKTSNGTADKLGKMSEVSCVAEAKSVKRKKKKKRSHSEGIGIPEDVKSMKRQKRDKNIDEPESGNDKFKLADSKKQKDEQTLDTLSNKTDKKCMKKKKKQKLHTEEHLLEPERSHKGETISVKKERKGVEQIENDMECITKSKKKKKKRSVEAEGEGIGTVDKDRLKLDKTNYLCKFENSPAKLTAEGKKQETAFDVLEESVEIKKKIKRKKKETSSGSHVKKELCDSDDLQFMSEKKGNLFEVTIDKARRKALQEEIDRVSGKTVTSETKASPEIKPRCTGTQWDTTTFESTEQKNKFLRLMGAFKSSNQPQSSGRSSGKPNMALNKEEQQKFNNTLQKEFDKALNLRQNRGIGLGFQPFPNQNNKTFFIDKHASKSKKFDFN
ncbi:lysine-rich nucleolar protein 1-like isoform X2 [Heterodontus francisci]|uniref:lysine-rich nucleolar protein 1-like isoform X2 n=1 Tax=Heterodontus francisci TaxID=7792 RepID=UPI00355B7D49